MTTGVPNYQRILVKLRKGNQPLDYARFSQCILDYFGFGKVGIGKLFAHMEDNSLILSDYPQSNEDSVTLKHPSFCPIHHLTESNISELPHETASRGVDVGSTILLESCDGKVLLLKRAEHLRIFPGIWVPPGGHMELGESLVDAGLRELKEETGLDVSAKDFVNGEVKLLALWESAFPAKLTSGLPKRHHIVSYLHASLKEGLTAEVMGKRINFDPQEVQACAWLDREFLTAIVEACEETGVSKQHNIPSTISAIVENENKQQVRADIPTAPLLTTMGGDRGEGRVSTGTKFALQQYLQLTSATSSVP